MSSVFLSPSTFGRSVRINVDWPTEGERDLNLRAI